jgi:hypothetical protein
VHFAPKMPIFVPAGPGGAKISEADASLMASRT